MPTDIPDLQTWLRQQCSRYEYGLAGVLALSRHQGVWPLEAATPEDLVGKLTESGQLLPLPKEPAALANVLEVSISDFLVQQVESHAGGDVTRGSERGYPDLEFSGVAFGGGYHAVDVKVARRKKTKRGVSSNTNSRITLYTGNTYFKHPDLHWPGTLRPFDQYASHLDIIVLYTLNPQSEARVEDLELLVQEPWRIASRHRSSATREYIGAVQGIDALRRGRGEFGSPSEFYKYWRSYRFRVSPGVTNILVKLLKGRDGEG